MSHQEIIQLIISYTLLIAFVFTVVITCLSLIGKITFSNPHQQNKLFMVLVVELVIVCVGYFAGFINLNIEGLGEVPAQNTTIQKKPIYNIGTGSPCKPISKIIAIKSNRVECGYCEEKCKNRGGSIVSGSCKERVTADRYGVKRYCTAQCNVDEPGSCRDPAFGIETYE